MGSRVSPVALDYEVTLDADGKGNIADFALIASVGANIKGAVTSDGSVHYATLEKFYESYKDEYAEE